MSRKEKTGHFIFALSALMLFFPAAASAYLDPGTGSMILQLLGVAFIAIGGVWVAFKSKIKAFFARRRGEEVPGDDDDNDAQTPPTDTK